MNQKLSNWASIAEIVSSLGVVVTLIFLIFGIQENTDINRAMVYDRNMDSLNMVRGQVVQDRNLADLYLAYQTGQIDRLDEIDLMRLRLFVNMIFGVYEKTYYSYKFGILGENEWSRYALNICVQINFMNDSFKSEVESVVTEEFSLYINELCENGP